MKNCLIGIGNACEFFFTQHNFLLARFLLAIQHDFNFNDAPKADMHFAMSSAHMRAVKTFEVISN